MFEFGNTLTLSLVWQLAMGSPRSVTMIGHLARTALKKAVFNFQKNLRQGC